MANLPHLLYPHGSQSNKLLERVLTRRELSATRFGGQNSVFREIQRQYLSMLEPLTARHPDQPVSAVDEIDQPDVYVPVPFTIIESAVPTWMFQVFGDSPPVRVYGRTEEDHQVAENLQELLDYYFKRSRVFLRTIPVAKQLFKFGTGIFKVEYKFDQYERKETWVRDVESGLDEEGKIVYEQEKKRLSRKVTRYDGPWLVPQSVTHSFPDPLFSEIEEMRYFGIVRYTDKRRLEWENEMQKRLGGKPLYKDLDKIPAMSQTRLEELIEGGAGPEEEVASAMGWNSSLRNRDRYTTVGRQQDPNNEVVEIFEYWSVDEESSGDKLVQIANGAAVIHDGPNPYDDKELPFGAVRCFPLEGCFWGYGLLHPTRSLVPAVNDWRNYMMRNAEYNALRSWGVTEDMEIPPSADFFRPGDVVQIPFSANGRPLAVDLFAGRALPPEAYQYEDRLIQDIQRAVGSNAMIEPSADTATEAQLLRAGSAMRERLHGAIGEIDYLAKVAKFYVSRSQQFFEEGTIIRILGPKSATFKKLDPQDIAGEFDFEVEGTSLHPNKTVIRQQLIQALALTNGNPVLLSITDMYELWAELLKSFDIRNYRRILNPPTDKTFDPVAIENPALLAGNMVPVEPSEPHELHVEAHNQALQIAVAQGAAEAEEAIRAHLKEHEKYLMLAQNQTPPQEQPGPKPNPGNQPNEPAVPTEAGMVEQFGGPGGME